MDIGNSNKIIALLALYLIFPGCDASKNNEGTIQRKTKGYVHKEEQGAKYPGGFGEMRIFFKKNLIYPSVDWEGVAEVYVQATITENGKLINLSMKRGYDELIDKEVLRVASLMPNWTPKKDKDGKPVADSNYIFPVRIEHYKGDPVN